MDKKKTALKIAGNILEMLVDPTVIPVKERIYFRPEEVLLNKSYEDAKASSFGAYGNQSHNSDFYPQRNRMLSQNREASMDRRSIVASLDILSQNFKEDDPIAKDLRTMAYAVANISDEKLQLRMAETAPEDMEGVVAAEEYFVFSQKFIRDYMKKHPDATRQEAMKEAAEAWKEKKKEKGGEKKEEPKKEEKKASEEEVVAEVDADLWSDDAASIVASALVTDVVGMQSDPSQEDEDEKDAGKDKKDEDDEEACMKAAEEKEAGKIPGVPDGTGPGAETDECPMKKKEEETPKKAEEAPAEEPKEAKAEEPAKEEEAPAEEAPAEETEAKKKADEANIVDTDILAAEDTEALIDIQGIEMAAPMILTEELTDEDRSKLDQLFK